MAANVAILPGKIIPAVSVVVAGAVICRELMEKDIVYGGMPTKLIVRLGEEDIMEKSRICVFTPTYNRIKLLTRCYESLAAQTVKQFVWLIIDDGSTDDSERVVNEWIGEKKINIKYYRKKNAGKIRAIEDSFLLANEDLWMCLDSDDYLFDDAIEVILNKSKDILSNNSISGMIAVRSNAFKNPMQGKQYVSSIEKLPERLKFMEFRYKYKIPPEYVLIYKLNVIKQYNYPDYPSEKFMPESSVYCLMDKKYDLLTVNYPLMFSEQIDDGITRNHRFYVKKNPKGYTYTHAIIVENAPNLKCFFHSAICYQMGRALGGERYDFTLRKKIIVTLIKPIGYIAKLVLY